MKDLGNRIIIPIINFDVRLKIIVDPMLAIITPDILKQRINREEPIFFVNDFPVSEPPEIPTTIKLSNGYCELTINGQWWWDNRHRSSAMDLKREFWKLPRRYRHKRIVRES